MLLHCSFGCLEFFFGRVVGLQLVIVVGVALGVTGGILLRPTAILALDVQILLMLLAIALLLLLLL